MRNNNSIKIGPFIVGPLSDPKDDQMDPDDPLAPLSLAVSLHNRGENERAELVLREAIVRDPNDTGVQLFLGTLLNESGNLTEAIALFRRATETEPSNSWAHLFLGNALIQLGDVLPARQEWQRVLKLDSAIPLVGWKRWVLNFGSVTRMARKMLAKHANR